MSRKFPIAVPSFCACGLASLLLGVGACGKQSPAPKADEQAATPAPSSGTKAMDNAAKKTKASEEPTKQVDDGTRDFQPGQIFDYEIAPGVKVKFCWIPPGEVQMGSPKTEPGHNDADEDEKKRGVFKTKGFWLGKYTVTQAEYEALMGPIRAPSGRAEVGDRKWLGWIRRVSRWKTSR